MTTFNKIINHFQIQMVEWAKNHLAGLFIFNLILMVLILLHSAGYFAPYLPITINMIMFLSLLMAVFLLGAKSKIIFLITLFFWVFGCSLKILGIEVWAERTAVYAFEGLCLGVALQVFENWSS